MNLLIRLAGPCMTGVLLIFCYTAVQAQSPENHHLILRKINIYGNNRTKAPIILRELPFRSGDTIQSSDYAGRIAEARENVFNTRLFNFVTIDSTSVSADKVLTDINVRVIERWYIWPWPYFEVSDRNFNSWLQTTDWSRLTYGIDFTFQNVRGRNETLKIPVHLGFNQKFGLLYQMPWLNKKKTIGAEFGALYQRNHEVIVTSEENKPVYYKDENLYPSELIVVNAGLILRKGIYAKHTFSFAYSWYSFSDTLLKQNPEFSVSTRPDFLTFYYQFKNDHRDVHYYPLKGSYFDVELYKYGFFQEVDELHLKSSLRKYWRLHNRWYFASGATVSFNVSGQQNYFLQNGLGYGREFVRGYEYYVIDGKSFGLLKNNLKFAIIPPRVLDLGFIRSKKFGTVPYALYMNVFADLGYVHNTSAAQNRLNDLQDALLVGYGAGFDFTTYYDVVIRLEFSLNGMGEPGIYLHFMAPI